MQGAVKEDSARSKCPAARTEAGLGRFAALIVPIALVGLAAFSAPKALAAADQAAAQPGRELIVGFTSGVVPAERRVVADRAGADLIQPLGSIHGAVVAVEPGESVAHATGQLERSPDVEFVEPNYEVKAARKPNDPMFKDQSGFDNLGALGGAPNADIAAPLAWDHTVGGPVMVAVVDTGIDASHPDLAANMWTNPAETENGLDDDRDGNVDDVHGANFGVSGSDGRDDAGHGSHVAGTIAAVGDNHVGVAGVAWEARLMALKFLDGNGAGSVADAVDAIDYAVDHGAQIISASWGTPDSSTALRNAIERAGERNVLFVAAAGNEGVNADAEPMYPGAYDLPNLISVASSDSTDRLSAFSNYGASSVDIAAPGENVTSTVPFSVDASGYTAYSGTSMATPAVSGAAVLYKSEHLNAPATEVRSAILSAADPIPSMKGKTTTGGRLDLARTLGVEARSQDRTAPTRFNLLRPTRRLVGGRHAKRFRWQRSYDKSGIFAYKLYIDGRLRKTIRDPDGSGVRLAKTSAKLKLRRGRHVWSVRAVDTRGNGRVSNSAKRKRATRSILVNK